MAGCGLMYSATAWYWALVSSSLGFGTCDVLRVSATCQTPNLEDQISVFMTPGDRVAQLYPKALGSSGPWERHFPYPK
jgi:hypothetical protein